MTADPKATYMYTVSGTDYSTPPILLAGFRERRRPWESTEEQKYPHRYEFMTNTVMIPERNFYGTLIRDKDGRVLEFLDDTPEGKRVKRRHYLQYVDLKVIRQLAKSGEPAIAQDILDEGWSEGEVQNFFLHEIVPTIWWENDLTEAAAAEIGTVTHRSDGYDWQKFGPRDWRRIAKTGTRPDKYGPEPGSRRPDVSEEERKRVLERAYSQNPTHRVEGYEFGHVEPKSGYWRDKALGLPENTNEKYLVDRDTGEYTPERKHLHDLIAKEVLSHVKPVGEGEHPVAVLTMGAPASGKSSSIDEVTRGEARNMANIDADLVKECLPEYREAISQRARNAAELVQDESAQVAESIREQAMTENKSFVFHGVRGDPEYYREFMGRLNQAGYEVNVVYMWMPDKDEVKDRADRRAEITGRRVPHDVIDSVMPVVTPNFKEIEDLSRNAYVYDARGRTPEVAWKREDDQIKTSNEEFAKELKESVMSRTESKDSDTGRPRRDRKTRPEHAAQDVVDLVLRGYEHDERVLDELEKTGYRFGKDEGYISGMGDERPGKSLPLKGKKNRSR